MPDFVYVTGLNTKVANSRKDDSLYYRHTMKVKPVEVAWPDSVCCHLIAQRPNYGHSLLVYLVKHNDWLNYVADRLSIDFRNLLLKIQ